MLPRQTADEKTGRVAAYYEGKNALVTGGFGFIGSHMAKALVELGANVTVFDIRTDTERDSMMNDPALGLRDKVQVITGDLANAAAVKDSAQTHWMFDPATSKIYTTVGATRYYLTARTPAESLGATDRRVYITSAAVGNGYQQWAITPDYINNRGRGATGNAEILNELSPGVLTVGPYFNYPASTKFAWHFNP